MIFLHLLLSFHFRKRLFSFLHSSFLPSLPPSHSFFLSLSPAIRGFYILRIVKPPWALPKSRIFSFDLLTMSFLCFAIVFIKSDRRTHLLTKLHIWNPIYAKNCIHIYDFMWSLAGRYMKHHRAHFTDEESETLRGDLRTKHHWGTTSEAGIRCPVSIPK